MANELDKVLYTYMLLLDEADKKSVLQINVEPYNKEIEEAIARVEAGEFFTQDEVEKMLKAW